MAGEPKYLKEVMIDIMDANPGLTGEQVNSYARRILEAESREDFQEMNLLLQEVYYGHEKQKAMLRPS